MKLKDLKEELNKLPKEVDDYEVIIADGPFFFSVDNMVHYENLKMLELYSYKNMDVTLDLGKERVRKTL